MNDEKLFSMEDVSRLLRLAASVCKDQGCDPGAAVETLQGALAGKIVVDKPPYRDPVEFAAKARRVRLRRNALFGIDAFRDPAWDMLLDLFAADADPRGSCISTLCHGAGVPASTAVRHLDRLAAGGYVERLPDPGDRRRELVRLTAKARPRIAEIIRQMQECC